MGVRKCPTCGYQIAYDEASGLWIGEECDHGFTDQYIATIVPEPPTPELQPQELQGLRNLIAPDPGVARDQIWGTVEPPPNAQIEYIPARAFNPNNQLARVTNLT